MTLPFWFTDTVMVLRYWRFKRKYRQDQQYAVDKGFIKEFLRILEGIPDQFLSSLHLDQRQRVTVTVRVNSLQDYIDQIDSAIDKVTRHQQGNTVDVSINYPPVQQDIILDDFLIHQRTRVDIERLVTEVPRKLTLLMDLLDQQTSNQPYYQRRLRPLFIDGVHLLEWVLLMYRRFKS